VFGQDLGTHASAVALNMAKFRVITAQKRLLSVLRVPGRGHEKGVMMKGGGEQSGKKKKGKHHPLATGYLVKSLRVFSIETPHYRN